MTLILIFFFGKDTENSGNKQILWKTEGLHTNVSLHHCCMMGLNTGQASTERVLRL